jgi:hypothetical protein
MPVVRPVTLIAVVALTMGPCSRRDWWTTSGTRCAKKLGNYESSGASVCTAFAMPYKDTRRPLFWFGANAIAQGRDLAGFAKLGRRHLPTEDILVQRGL